VKLTLGLTNREQQLVVLIGKGLTNKEIACQLQLAEQTVRNHVHRMLRKVGANNRLAVVELCRMQGCPFRSALVSCSKFKPSTNCIRHIDFSSQ